MSGDLLQLLANTVDAGIAGRVIVGVNWVLVEGPDGVGLAHAPARDAPGCRPLPGAGRYAGAPLADLARLAAADNPFERALAVAAINATHNRLDVTGAEGNALALLGAGAERPVVVGRFPGAERHFHGLRVIERTPRAGEYPPEAAPELFADADLVVITASTLGNGTLPGLLAHPRPGRTVLLGPGTPLAPVLFRHGIDALAGSVVTDRDGAVRAVAEGGAAAALRPHLRMVTLSRPD